MLKLTNYFDKIKEKVEEMSKIHCVETSGISNCFQGLIIFVHLPSKYFKTTLFIKVIEFPQQNYQLRNTSCRMITVTNKYVVLENTFALGTNFEITYTCIRQQHECIQNKTIPIQSTQIVCNGTTFLFPFQSIKQGTFL